MTAFHTARCHIAEEHERIDVSFAVLRSRCVWDDPSYKRDALPSLSACLAAFAFSLVKFVGPLWDAGESGSNEVLRKGRRRGVNSYPLSMKPLMCRC